MTLKINETLSALLKERRMSMSEVSRATGVATSTLSEWTGGTRPKDPEQVQRVAEHLGVTLHFLLFGREDGQEPLQRILKEEVFNGTFEVTLKRIRISNGGT